MKNSEKAQVIEKLVRNKINAAHEVSICADADRAAAQAGKEAYLQAQKKDNDGDFSFGHRITQYDRTKEQAIERKKQAEIEVSFWKQVHTFTLETFFSSLDGAGREKKYHAESVEKVKKSLQNEAAGNVRCTMTDLDLACSMLEEYQKIVK